MKLAARLAILLLIVSRMQSQQCKETNKLPSYLGKGYDILTGNPLTREGDSGFRYEVIVLDYSNKRTENNKFLVPDNISFRRSQICSYEASASQYRGTQSYQQYLKTQVKVAADAKGVFFNFAFSASADFKSLENRLNSLEVVIYQASSVCTNYVLALDRYQRYKISANFFAAVEESIQFSDWSGFINQFGTHYITEVVLGGRAVQESQFSRIGVTELKQKGIDMQMSMKANFNSFFTGNGKVSASGGVTSNQGSASQVESLRTKVSSYYIGGRPPKDGDTGKWADQVEQEPMPIKYKIAPLSDLFQFNPGKKAEWVEDARASFNKGVQAHCKSQGCRNPTPDKDLPRKVYTLATSTSKIYGGIGGGVFSYNKRQAGWHITSVRLYYEGQPINSIQVGVSNPDRTKRQESKIFGKAQGTFEQVLLSEDQYITSIRVVSDTMINLIGFQTSTKRTFSIGSEVGVSNTIQVPAGFRWTGIAGKAGWHIDAIAFLFTKTVQDATYKHEVSSEREQ